MHHNSSTTDATVKRLYEAADDVGRLRAHLDPEPGSLTEWRLHRLAAHIEALIGIHEPTAADIVAVTHPDDHDTAQAALDHVDQRHTRLRRTLGHRKAA